MPAIAACVELLVGAPLKLLHGHPRQLRSAFQHLAFLRVRVGEELLHGDALLLRVGANASVQSRLGLRLDLEKRLSVLTPRRANRGRRTVTVNTAVARAVAVGVGAFIAARRLRSAPAAPARAPAAPAAAAPTVAAAPKAPISTSPALVLPWLPSYGTPPCEWPWPSPPCEWSCPAWGSFPGGLCHVPRNLTHFGTRLASPCNHE